MEYMEPFEKLNRDLKKAASTLSKREVRFLVDNYYTMQGNRIRGAAQVREMTETGEPHEILAWYSNQFRIFEDEVKKALDAYSRSTEIGQWLRSICGIGPVIAAGLIAFVDIEKADSAGKIWQYAGLNPNQEWKKGETMPWNARLKTLCWKIGESFVKVSANKNDVYGKVYVARKELEISRNEALEFREQATAKLAKFKIGKDTEAFKWYSVGKLPPAHIHARAKRYAVKLFLAHFHEVYYEITFGKKPPAPYPIAILGHKDRINPPNWK